MAWRINASRGTGFGFVALALMFLAAGPAPAQEVVVQNDSVVDGSTVAIQVGFLAGESAAAWLTSPCDGSIVAVQVFWVSLTGNTPQSLEDSITIFDGGMFPVPGAQLELLEGPLFTDGVLNEFRFLDDNQTIPIDVPVTTDQVFVVSLKFANTPDIFNGPSVVTDIDGCQAQKNAVFDISTWRNLCGFGASGDWFIRAVVDCGTITGACCDADLTCANNVSAAQCQGPGQTFFPLLDCTQVTCPQPGGACCLPNEGGCEIRTQNDCATAGGTFLGEGSTCTATACLQACCVPAPGTFCVLEDPDVCVGLGGTPQGIGTFCVGLSSDECPVGACCLPDGSCQADARPAECALLGGSFQGDGTLCSEADCPAPMGACCLSAGGCQIQSQLVCENFGNAWAGPGTLCPDDCAAPCPGADGDMNGDQQTDAGDVQPFVDGLLGPPDANATCHGDFNGSSGLDVGDVPGMVAALLGQ